MGSFVTHAADYHYSAGSQQVGKSKMLAGRSVLNHILKSKKPSHRLGFLLETMAPRPGLEPGTYGLTVRRSTD